ncbi:uncharacterized protein LOC108864261 [Galendromus occidentalis]|uniref:Uncharacterized protein LOC108864261 n=1 Tax=Galendromus occidentalis TaxID=34638 RepID=A0AAJ7L664_9ACAR|nr:uncharacterized protein LOC108864261 [Galendromus occidentalis]
MLTETFLTNEPEEQIIQHYKSFTAGAQKTKGRPSGGLAILASALIPNMKTMFKNEYALGVQDENTTYIVAYYKPNTPVAEIIIDIHNIVNKIVTKSVILYGDFNCRIDVEDSRARSLIEAFLLLNLHLLNKSQDTTYIAHNGRSTIDLIFVTADLVPFTKMKIMPTVDRKHQRIIVDIPSLEPEAEIKGKRPMSAIRKVDHNKLVVNLSNSIERAEPSPDDSYMNLLGAIEKAAIMETHKGKPKNKPWFDEECNTLKQLALSKIRTEDYTKHRRKYKDAIKKKRCEHELKELEKRVHASRAKPWLMLPRRKAPCIPKIEISDFEDHYGRLYSNTEPTHPEENDDHDEHEDNNEIWYNEYITNEEVAAVISRLKRHKAVGPDRIAADVLKDNEILTPLITRIFNESFDSGTIPDSWRIAYVKPLFKGKGSADDPNNYRCINLASHMYKAFTSTITNRLIQHCLPYISENQHGFLPHRSCEDAIEALMKLVEENTKPTYAVFVDFKTAFDNVNRKKLIQTIEEKFHIKGKMLNILRSILQPNSLIIDNGTHLSEHIRQHKGVVQGDANSPLLFVLFINGLLERLERRKTLVKMYADDLVIASDDADEVQRALSALTIWCDENEMSVNTDENQSDEVPKSRRTRTATVTICLGDLRKLPLNLAMKIYDMKIMAIVRYGMSTIAPHLAKTTMTELDKSKTIFLKATLGLSRESLKIKRAKHHNAGFTTGPAFTGETWKKANQKNRAYICRDHQSNVNILMPEIYMKRALCLNRAARSRYVYVLSGAPLMIDVMRQRIRGDQTAAFSCMLQEWSKKVNDALTEVSREDIFKKPELWAGSGLDDRHKFTRYCGLLCGKYHATRCLAGKRKTKRYKVICGMFIRNQGTYNQQRNPQQKHEEFMQQS